MWFVTFVSFCLYNINRIPAIQKYLFCGSIYLKFGECMGSLLDERESGPESGPGTNLLNEVFVVRFT